MEIAMKYSLIEFPTLKEFFVPGMTTSVQESKNWLQTLGERSFVCLIRLQFEQVTHLHALKSTALTLIR